VHVHNSFFNDWSLVPVSHDIFLSVNSRRGGCFLVCDLEHGQVILKKKVSTKEHCFFCSKVDAVQLQFTDSSLFLFVNTLNIVCEHTEHCEHTEFCL